VPLHHDHKELRKASSPLVAPGRDDGDSVRERTKVAPVRGRDISRPGRRAAGVGNGCGGGDGDGDGRAGRHRPGSATARLL
jgi:hypothetical protein